MDPLKEIFESAVLTDETKVAMRKSFETLVEAAKTEIEASYNQKLTEAQQSMMDSLPAIVEEAVAEELAAVAEEVAHARTLEVSYAEKLNTFKESYAEKQEEQTRVLVAESVAEIVEEMKEDIELAKKHEFAVRMFESFKDTYETLFGGTELSVVDELKEAKEALDKYQRKEKMEELLEGLTGDKRNIAETILEGVATDKLESKFNHIRSALLTESTKKPKEDKTLEEGVDAPAEEVLKEHQIVLDPTLEEGKDEKQTTIDPIIARLQRSIRIGRNEK